MAKVIIFHTPVRYGGGERQLILLSKEFKKNNLDFIIINLAKSEEFEKELDKNQIPFSTITNKKLGDSPSKKDYFFHLLSLLRKLFKKELKLLYKNAKIVYARDFPANFFVYFLIKIYGKDDKKFIYSRHFYKNPEKGLVKKVYFKVLKNFDVLIGVSEYVSKSLLETFPELKEKILTIPNGIDLKRFDLKQTKEELRKEFNLPLNDLLAIYIARFTLQKNHIFLIDVLKNIEGFKLILIGEGNTKSQFMEEISKNNLNDRVILLGYIENSKIPYYLKASDFCLFPSKGEGFSNAILEAMAASLPTVIFKDIYSPEYGDNILVANSEKSFIDYCQKLVNDELFRRKISEKIKEHIKKFDIKNIAQRYLEFFKYEN